MKIPLSWQIVLSAVLAIIVGYFFPTVAVYAGEFDGFYIKILTLLMIPYVFSGIIGSLTKSYEHDKTGRITLRTLTMFVIMEVIAIFTALLISNISLPMFSILPQGIQMPELENPRYFGDFIYNLIPTDIFSATQMGNISALIVIACLFGLFTNRCADKSRIFLTNLFSSVNEVMTSIADFVAKLSPIGIFCLTSKVMSDGQIFNQIDKVKPLVVVTAIALLVHSLITIPIMVKTMGGCNPYRYMKMFGSVLFQSLSFSTSTLAVPLAINRMKKEVGISDKVANYGMPLISMLNFNGTSIFLACAAMYTAQAYGINMSIIEQAILLFAVSFITIGTVANPLKLSLIMLPVLESMGIPIEGMGALMICEILFGMVCSMVDLWSNIAITATTAYSEGDRIKTEIPQ